MQQLRTLLRILNEKLDKLLDFPTLDHLRSATPDDTQAAAVMGLIKRKLGDHSSQFSVTIDTSIGPKNKDTFKVRRQIIIIIHIACTCMDILPFIIKSQCNIIDWHLVIISVVTEFGQSHLIIT